MSESKRKLEAYLEQKHPMPDEGDWYCRNCGYLSSSRVTHSETCDTCHTPVEFHTAEQQTRIEKLTADSERLRVALEWYAEHVDNCGTLHGVKRGDESRHLLSQDRGKIARQALTTPTENKGDDDGHT